MGRRPHGGKGRARGIVKAMLSSREFDAPQTGVTEVQPDPTFDRRLRLVTGYRVDGPEGYVGVVESVPLAGNPKRPLVLVVRGGETIRFVSLTRVATVLPGARRVSLWPRSRPRKLEVPTGLNRAEMGPVPDSGERPLGQGSPRGSIPVLPSANERNLR